MKVYGPYTRKDNRKHVVIVHADGSKQTKSYPKFLLEQKIGRELTDDETCDHKDNDFTNDDPDNLVVLTRVDNVKKAWDASDKRSKSVEVVCPNCSTRFVTSTIIINGNRRCSRAGPFCSKNCAGAYGANVQSGRDFVQFS